MKVNFSPGFEVLQSLFKVQLWEHSENVPLQVLNLFVILKFNPSFKGNQIVLNEAHVGKGEQLRAGKPRKEDDIEV